ncbi:EcsC family protein [Nocardioides sp. R-C-SC26]|uniref:EcsC family protein n=1 Tax=Nocardioides sp. R-C-SC26 TaxID=2870414 RepID=UPI001E403AA1|nr:EcsC family protein [Nocardioides sp. R-C-SC26]
MGAKRSIGTRLATQVAPRLAPKLAPKLAGAAPGVSASFVREALHRAVDGVGPFQPAHLTARRALEEHEGDVRKAVHAVVDDHVRFAGAAGFVTNLGGLVTLTVTLPANLTGLAVLQCRMVAAVAHLRGYDIQDPRVHNAILVTTLGADAVDGLIKQRRLPAPPMAIATAPVHDASLDQAIASAVAAELIARVAGRRLATTAGRRVPVVGGLVGMGADGWATWKIGRYAEREFLPRAPR